VLDIISDGLLAVDERRYLTLINRVAQDLFGLDPATVVGRPINTLDLGDTRLSEALEGCPCLRAQRHWSNIFVSL
jgi:sensor histidine kinase regulating citrate/malate metabolism